MAKYSHNKCIGCPYRNQVHLSGTNYYNISSNIPLSIDKGINSNTLIVLQAPGEEEWKIKRPLNASIRRGGTAGSRIESSWSRVGKTRTDYDITNSVQCFPGKDPQGGDLKPPSIVIDYCFEWLKEDIKNGSYTKIIGFGNIANEQIEKARVALNIGSNVQIVQCTHPNGGLKNLELDRTW